MGTFKSRIAAFLLTCCMAASVLFPTAVPAHAAAPARKGPAEVFTGFSPNTTDWDKIVAKLSGIYGEWTVPDFRGQTTSKTPDTALLGNGDVGVSSGGDAYEKTFRISKGDFWSANTISRSYQTSAVTLGGITLGEKQETGEELGDNLAVSHLSVTASSYHDDFYPVKAVNGNFQQSPNGYGWVTKVGREHWLALEFEEPITFQRWLVRNDGAVRSGHSHNNTSDFSLQTSETGATWTDIKTVTDNKKDVFSGNLDTPVTTKWVRLYVTNPLQHTNGDANPRARIGQLELYAQPGEDDGSGEATPKNLALSKPAFACCAHENNPTAWGGHLMVDGNATSKWCATNKHDNNTHRAYIDLGARKTISAYSISGANTVGEGKARNTKDFQLQYLPLELEEAIAWDDIANVDSDAWLDMDSVTGNNEDILEKNLDAPATARYVRLLVTRASAESNNEHVLRIHELELYEEPIPEPEPFYEKQDILNAAVETTQTIAGIPLEMKTWTSATKNLIVMEITSKGAKTGTLQLKTWVKNDNSNFPVESAVSGDTVIAQRATYNGVPDNEMSWTSKAALATKLIGGASATAAANTSKGFGTLDFTIEPGQTVYAVTSVGGGGQTYDNKGTLQGEAPGTQATALLEQVSSAADVQALHADHLAWWKDYWSASFVDLGGSTATLQKAERYYYAAQYFLGSGVREGKMAPGLYGIWHTTDNPSWSSDFHLNYNFISPFYGTSSSNRPELYLPVVSAIEDYLPQGAANAQSITELRKVPPSNLDFIQSKINEGKITEENGIEGGILYPVGLGPWGVATEPSTYLRETVNAPYSAYAMITYYNYTQDEDFMVETLYPYLVKCATFLESWLGYKDDPYTLYAGYNEGSWAQNPTVELAAYKSVLANAVAISEKMGVDDAKRATWQTMLDNMADQPTAQYAGKTVYALAEKEWNGSAWVDMTSPIPGDGNILPLESFIPGNILGYYSSAEALQTARNTIDVFGNNAWRQINNFPRIFPDAIRARYPAQTILDNMAWVIDQQMQPNLRISDGVHGIEKSGATEAINSMLLQSDKGVTKVFPNWVPDVDASFDCLRAPGAFVISARYDGSTQSVVEGVKITSEAGKTLTFAVPWADGAKVLTGEGELVEITEGTAPNWEDEATITFDTEAGKTYYVVKADEKPNEALVALRALYDEAAGLEEALYTAESWATLESAMAGALEVLDAADPTNAAIEAAHTALQSAIDGLVERQVHVPVTGVSVVPDELSLDIGETALLTADVLPEDATDKAVSWTSGDDGVATVDQTGKVTAISDGTATITVTTEDGGFEAECIVTVTDPAAEAKDAEYRLGTTSVIVDTLRIDPAVEIPVVRTSGDDTAPASLLDPANTFSILPAGKAAEATVKGLKDNFKLEAKDDGTLRLVPTRDISGLNLKSNYKMQILLENGSRKIIFKNTLTVTVNKKVLVLKAVAIKVNSFYNDKTAPITFTNGIAAKIELDGTRNDKLLKQGWLKMGADNQSIEILKSDRSYNGSLHLLVTPEGWTKSAAVTVKVSAANIPPALKLADSTARVFAEVGRTNGVPMQLLPKERGVTLEDLGVQKLRLATAAEAPAKTYKAQGGYIVEGFAPAAGKFTLKPVKANALPEGKLLLMAEVKDGGAVPVTVTVTVLKAGTKVSLKADKSTLTLNPNLTGGESYTLTVTPSIPGLDLSGLKAELYDAKNKAPNTDATVAITDKAADGTAVTLHVDKANAGGKTYKLRLTLPEANPGKKGARTDAETVVTVKTLAKSSKNAAFVALSVKGKINLTTGTGVCINATFKNYLGGFAETPNFVVKDSKGNVMPQFSFTQNGSGWRMSLEDGASLAKGTYTLWLDKTAIAGGGTVETAKGVKFTVMASKSK